MFYILIVMLICFLITLAYDAVIAKFTRNKFIFFLPTFIAIVWFSATLYWYYAKPAEGLEQLTLYLVAIFAVVIVSTNIFATLIFSKRKDKRLK